MLAPTMIKRAAPVDAKPRGRGQGRPSDAVKRTVTVIDQSGGRDDHSGIVVETKPAVGGREQLHVPAGDSLLCLRPARRPRGVTPLSAAHAARAAHRGRALVRQKFQDEYDPARPNDYSVYIVEKRKKAPTPPRPLPPAPAGSGPPAPAGAQSLPWFASPPAVVRLGAPRSISVAHASGGGEDRRQRSGGGTSTRRGGQRQRRGSGGGGHDGESSWPRDGGDLDRGDVRERTSFSSGGFTSGGFTDGGGASAPDGGGAPRVLVGRFLVGRLHARAAAGGYGAAARNAAARNAAARNAAARNAAARRRRRCRARARAPCARVAEQGRGAARIWFFAAAAPPQEGLGPPGGGAEGAAAGRGVGGGRRARVEACGRGPGEPHIDGRRGGRRRGGAAAGGGGSATAAAGGGGRGGGGGAGVVCGEDHGQDGVAEGRGARRAGAGHDRGALGEGGGRRDGAHRGGARGARSSRARRRGACCSPTWSARARWTTCSRFAPRPRPRPRGGWLTRRAARGAGGDAAGVRGQVRGPSGTAWCTSCGGDVPPDQAVRIFVMFDRAESAMKAVIDLHGRFFGPPPRSSRGAPRRPHRARAAGRPDAAAAGGREVKAIFFDEDKFHMKRFDPEDTE